MPESLAEISEATSKVLVNRVVRQIASLAARAWDKRWIVTCTATTGVGKTRAIDYIDGILRFDHQVIKCKQITRQHALLQALGLAPGEKWNNHGRNWMSGSDLYARAVERIRQRPFLLILDEADRLRSDCFELLRDFWDDARLPMLLVGNEVLTDKINAQHERLFRRIRIRFPLKSLSQAELREMLAHMGFGVSDEEFAFLWKLAGGSPGYAEALLEDANEIAATHKQKRGIEDLEGAADCFPTFRKDV
jgi:DNA transposition AAA+ family ATPase